MKREKRRRKKRKRQMKRGKRRRSRRRGKEEETEDEPGTKLARNIWTRKCSLATSLVAHEGVATTAPVAVVVRHGVVPFGGTKRREYSCEN